MGVETPKNWPSNVVYLSSPKASKCLSAQDRQRFCSFAPLPGDAALGQLKIKVISDPKHPACGQRGLFATKNLSPGAFIIDYIGTVHTEVNLDPQSDYDLSLERTWAEDGSVRAIAIDARYSGNEARFVNDYRGTGTEKANVEFRLRTVQHQGIEVVRMALFVGSKPISKGQELLVSYGKAWWASRSSDASLS